MARTTLDKVMAQKPELSRARLDATIEQDIRRYQTEDGYDATPVSAETVVLPQAVRKKLGMTQDEFARALRIPLATLRNWEQGRVKPDPAARSLLLIVHRSPKAALKALAA